VKVLFDISCITQPLSGVGRYALELARRLPLADKGCTVRFLRDGQVQDGFDAAAVPAPAAVSRPRQWLKSRIPYRQLLGPYRRRKARLLAASLRDYDDHIYYSPNFSLLPIGGPSVVTVHDLSVFHFPECHPRDRVNYIRDQIRHSVAEADRLVTPSRFVRGELMDLFGLSPERVVAIPNGVDTSFRPHARAELEAVTSQYKLHPGGYLLSVGTIEPRKNLSGLLAAYRRLDAALRRRYPLVIAGAYGWNAGPLMDEIESLQRSGEVIYLNYVPEQQLPALYAGAAAFGYFSYYEGFGLPVLEAMSSGVPVVCADSSALPELCGDIALLADAHDVQAMADALRTALEDSAWRTVAIERGLALSAGFTWQHAADRLAGVFRELAA